jgi:uncharacterized RDD family membrane protein YckC
MTLNDIILRDLAACRREEEAEMAKRGLAEYEREIKRRLWTRRIKAALPTLLAVTFGALLVAVAKMF